jgi:hypothetical protein
LFNGELYTIINIKLVPLSKWKISNYKYIKIKQGQAQVAHATQEVEIRRMSVRSQTGQIVHETLSQKHQSQKRAGGVTQGVGPEFKPQYHK